jgi:CDP-diacylglycerol---serine O-phosphatidyltransferase
MENKIRYFTLPNILTLINLIAGSFAIYFAFEAQYEKLYYASYFVFLAVVFDMLDGTVARLTKSTSEIGKQLDSLADLVSFGVAPAVITYQMIKAGLEIDKFSFDLSLSDILILLTPILLVVAGALRLAKFNVDNRQKENFMGLPIPASAIFFASLPLLNVFDPYKLIVLKDWLDMVPFKFVLAVIGLQVYILTDYWFFLISIFFMVFMQLINFPIFSLKFQGFGYRQNAIRYIFLLFAVLLFALFQSFSLPFIVIFYILFAVFVDVVKLFKK